MNALETTQALTGTIVDDVVARGDLSKLTSEQRVVHYHNVCRTLGLNPATQPFAYVELNKKLVLYARRDACDQLRKLHGINIQVVDRVAHDGLLTVHVRATDKTGRQDEDFGVVSIAGKRGDDAANAIMKAVTKAKRRVTLSIAGLGFSSEDEIESLTPTFQEAPANKAVPKYPPAGKTYAEATREDLDRDPIEKAAAERKAKEPPETGPYRIGRDTPDEAGWITWANKLKAHIEAAREHDIDEWLSLNDGNLAELEQFNAAYHERMMSIINDAKAAQAAS